MKTALVTGANKGIGYEVARQLARNGFHVFVGARNVKAGRNAAREFSDVEDHLDVLVNNAGIIVDGDAAILEISDDLLRKTLETNTLGPLRLTRAFTPLLRKSKAPRV